jgi:LuxR family transcriptional regulator, maltose regulon positive regulatory protein
MAKLLTQMTAQLAAKNATQGSLAEFIGTLRKTFETEERKGRAVTQASRGAEPKSVSETLSQRELEVFRLLAQGHSNEEISKSLCLALSTVKGHILKIFAKLQVQRRTEAVARGRELGLL